MLADGAPHRRESPDAGQVDCLNTGPLAGDLSQIGLHMCGLHVLRTMTVRTGRKLENFKFLPFSLDTDP